MKPNDIALVVFDLAGTLLDFGCQAPAGAFVEAFRQRGVTVSLREARGPMGLHKKDHIRAMLRTDAVAEKWKAAAKRDWAEADVEALYGLVTPMQVAAAKVHCELVPQALDCFHAMKAMNLKIAVSTGYFREAAEICFEALERQGFTPDFRIGADEVPAGRPAPWMIFRCMEALNVYPPSTVVKIGDTVVDVHDGLNAGAWSLAVIDSSSEMGLPAAEFAALTLEERTTRRTEVRARFTEAGAHAVLDDLTTLPSTILAIKRGDFTRS